MHVTARPVGVFPPCPGFHVCGPVGFLGERWVDKYGGALDAYSDLSLMTLVLSGCLVFSTLTCCMNARDGMNFSLASVPILWHIYNGPSLPHSWIRSDRDSRTVYWERCLTVIETETANPRVVEPPGPRLPGTGAIAPCPGRCTCPPAFIAFVPSRNRNARTMHGSGFLLEGKIVNENTKKREVPEKGNQALKNLTYHNNFGGQLPIQLSSCWPHFRYYHFFLKKKIQIQFLL